jgi:HlyD family secretion protein
MTRARKRTLIIAIAIVVLAVIIFANLRPKAEKGSEVRTEEIEAHKIEAWVRAPGRIQPVTQVQVSSNVTGRIAEIHVEEGQRVRAGDLLLRLDDERYRSLVQQYRAQIQAAEANRVLAEAEQRESSENLERVRGLAERDLTSDQELIAAQTRAEVNAARVSAALEEIRRTRAALDQGEKDLRETVFTASMDGVVTALNVEVGENVITGTMNNPGTVILTLADLSAMEVEAEVDETDIINVEVGQKARVLVDAMPDTTLGGVVTRVGQSGLNRGGAQQEATNYEVAVLLESPPQNLRSGMNADVEILTGKRENVLAVPLQALTARPPSVVDRWEKKRAREDDAESGDEGEEEEEESAASDTVAFADRNLVEGVFLYEDGEARFVSVGLGLRGETHIEVFGDLEIGESLIVGPFRTLRTLRDQQSVRAEEKKAEEEQGEDGDQEETE